MKNTVQYNKFDCAIILMLGMLSFGNIGGATTPVRVIAIPFIIFLMFTSAVKIRKGPIADLHLFLVIFLFWMILSLGWSIDYGQAAKEVAYFLIHSSIFLGLVFAAGKADDPIKSVCLGWMVAVALTMPVAIAEFVLDWHLPVSINEAGTIINYGEGRIAQKIFASATFGNWNTYVTFLCFSLPFLIGCVYLNKLFFYKIISMVVIFAAGIIVIINASRGGLIAFSLISIFGIFNHLRLGGRGKWADFLSVLLIAGVGIWFSYDLLSFQMLARLDSVSLVGDDDRSAVFLSSLGLLVDSNFVGVGVGSLVAAYEKLGANVFLPHNVFMELLVQYGVVIFILFVYLLLRIYFLSRKSSDPVSKFVVSSALISLPIVGVINSGYWLNPLIWCYLASIFAISFHSRSRGGCIYISPNNSFTV